MSKSTLALRMRSFTELSTDRNGSALSNRLPQTVEQRSPADALRAPLTASVRPTEVTCEVGVLRGRAGRWSAHPDLRRDAGGGRLPPRRFTSNVPMVSARVGRNVGASA